MALRWYVLAALACAGCPSSNDAGKDGGASDMAMSTADDLSTGADDLSTGPSTPFDLESAPNTGGVTVTSATSAMDKSFTAYASFVMGAMPNFSPNCTEHTVGGCEAFACVIPDADAGSPPVTFSPVSGGDVTITGGAMPVTLTPLAPGYYQPIPSGAQPLFVGGETLTVTIAGAVAPAATLSVIAPSPPTLTTPVAATQYTITRSAGFALAWSGGGPGSVSFILQSGFPSSQPGTPYGAVRCTFPVADGSATVPPAALAVMQPGGATFQISVIHSASSTVGNWLMTADAVTYPVTPGGVPFSIANVTIN